MFNFDKIIDRSNTHALSIEGYRGYIFGADSSLKFKYNEDDFIHMWVADMSFETPECVNNAIRERLDVGNLGYTLMAHQSKAYTDAFSAWCERYYKFTLDIDELVSSDGIVPAVNNLAKYLCTKGDEILIFSPSYGMFRGAGTASGADMLCSKLELIDGNYEINWNDFELKAKRKSVKLCIFCSPHNPTGRCWSKDEIIKVAKICKENDVALIFDEIHCDLLRRGINHVSATAVLKKGEYSAVCLAPSKTFNIAGLQISNIIIPDEKLRQTWLNDHPFVYNPLSICGAIGAYKNGHAWLEELLAYLDENFALAKSIFAEKLPDVDFSIPDATYLAWVDLSVYFGKDEDLSMFFANEAGVLLEGGSGMFIDNADGFVRLNLACPRSIVKEGINRICDVIVRLKLNKT